MDLPYANATSGGKARDEIVRLLKHFECESVGFMDNFSEHSLMLQFVWRGRNIQINASARGWANAYLKKHPYSTRRRDTRQHYEQKALSQGMIAVNSMLRDWIKGQVTLVETGILSFEHVFMPHMLTSDGTPLVERVMSAGLLPAPQPDAE